VTLASMILLISLCVFLAIGTPVSFALIGSCLLAIGFGTHYPMLVVIKELFTGIDSFPLMAVPFFVLASELMTGGSLTRVLLVFSSQFIGHFRGGLGYSNIGSLTLFSGISGSALADAAGPGAMMIRMMERGGYDKGYAAALTASTSILGVVIPPSLVMIIYAMQDTALTVRGLFMAGVVPGLVIALGMAAVNFYVCRRRGYVSSLPRPGRREMVINSLKAIPALGLILLILLGIRGGVFTPTEASVIAVFYALVCGRWIYRSLAWGQLPGILARAGQLTGSVLLMIAATSVFSWVLTIERVPNSLAAALIALELSPIAFLLGVNLLLLLAGVFIEPVPGVMVLVPILAPVSAALGIDPLHFAMIVIVNLSMGMVTPPVGGLLFVTSAVAKIPSSRLTAELGPFMVAYAVILMLLTFFPQLSLWLPHHTV